MPHVQDQVDPLQFAYQSGRSTDDAVSTLIHRITKHLDAKSSNTVKILFIDFSSAFNTIQPHLMLEKLDRFRVPTYLQLWILDYLTNRPQYVRTSTEISDTLVLNTGAPQGCVLSPVLFILYTNDMSWNSDSDKVFIEKYADIDDAATVALIENDDDRKYRECIDFVTEWCNDNYLDLNVPKTKELVCDFRRKNKIETPPIVINNLEVARTDKYKYLGSMIDDKLSFIEHVEMQLSKTASRLYYARTLRKLNVNSNIIIGFYNSTIVSVLSYSVITFYEMLPDYAKYDLEQARRVCSKFVGNKNDLMRIEDIYRQRTVSMANKIMKDPKHPLNNEYNYLPSGKRLRVPYTRTSRYRNTFIPRSISLLNSS